MNENHARQGDERVWFGGAWSILLKKKFQSQAHFRNDLVFFSRAQFSVWHFHGFSPCFREEARGYCMKLETCSSFRSFASIPSSSWNKSVVNIHSLHNGRIPLNLIYQRESISVASLAELCVASTGPRLHSGACLSPGVLGLCSRHLHSCPHPLIEVLLGGFAKYFHRVPISKCRRNDGRENPHFIVLVINKWFRQEWSLDDKVSKWKIVEEQNILKGLPFGLFDYKGRKDGAYSMLSVWSNLSSLTSPEEEQIAVMYPLIW